MYSILNEFNLDGKAQLKSSIDALIIVPKEYQILSIRLQEYYILKG